MTTKSWDQVEDMRPYPLPSETKPICESCYQAGDLILCACGGGATGEIFLCTPHYDEHLTVCDECSPEGFNFPLDQEVTA